MKLVFATNNEHKLKEVQEILGDQFELMSLADLGCDEEIPETGPTLETNAAEKAWYIYTRYGVNCFADDTGLEVEALDGAPGVYSARYAGPQRDASDNIRKLLMVMDKINNRKARFRTVISLIIDGVETQFEGVVNGTLLDSLNGTAGFGYDPIFQPDGFELSFAQMDLAQKNEISHRGRAISQLVQYLNELK
ncbi:MAG: non-canonical purine NTP diphosphatase [Prolixibacteraceae bacterium]|nr:non-canonical purine NTP diphosphatase [Prolixibacteraceae bacterium]